MENNVDTLYYDGACPLCAHEMKLLKRLKTSRLALVDIHELRSGEDSQPDSLPGTETLLRVLHLRTGSGEWRQGIDATIAAWSHTRIGWLWRLLSVPGIRWLADKVYYPWARRRYDRLYCGTSPEASKQ